MNKAQYWPYISEYGPVSVIHFDSHLDTWKPKVFGGSPTEQASINHGTYFFHAAQEGLLANDSNIHAGIRTTLSGPSDYENDGYCGFEIVEAREIDKIGTDGIIKKIRDRVGTTKPVYLSIDIDTLDPACKSNLPAVLWGIADFGEQSRLLLVHPRRVAGRLVSFARLCVVLRVSTSSLLILLRSLLRMTPMLSWPPWLRL
jgi:hypothetical protein